MSRIALIGGHGKIALLAEPLLVAAGHEVTAIVRNPVHVADVEATGARAVVADLENMSTSDIADLLRGHDAVIWSAGAGGGNPERTYAVDRDAAIRSMDATCEAGINRYVMVSYFGARPDHGVPQDNSFFAYAEAKAAADTYLRASALNWTILMPSTLTLEPATGIDVDATKSGHVSREAVAQAITAVVDNPDTVGRDIRFNDGDRPVSEVFGS